METKIKAILCLIGISALVGGIWAGFSTEYGVIDSCSATYKTYVKAHYSETYMSVCYSSDSNGNSYSTACLETRSWSRDASPIWVTKTINGKHTTNAPEAYISNQGYYINDVPPKDLTLSNHSDFDYFRASRNHKLDVAVMILGEYQVFEKNTNFYKSCEIMRNTQETATIKLWYGNAYDTEMML